MSEGHNSANVAGAQLRSVVERIENLAAEIKERQVDTKEIYSEAKGNGWDVKTIRQLVRIRAADPAKLAEQDSLLEVYKSALGMV